MQKCTARQISMPDIKVKYMFIVYKAGVYWKKDRYKEREGRRYKKERGERERACERVCTTRGKTVQIALAEL